MGQSPADDNDVIVCSDGHAGGGYLMRKTILGLILFVTSTALGLDAQKRPVDYVNTFLGTAPLTNPADYRIQSALAGLGRTCLSRSICA